MSPSHLSPSQGGSAAPAPTEEIWVLRKPFAGTVGTCCQSPGPRAAHARTQRGDRSSLGSTGSVASARSSGSGQSAGSGAHALHAGSEGVKVRPGTGWGLQVAPGSSIGACSGAGLGSLGSRDPILSSAPGSLLRLTLSPALQGAAGTRRGCRCRRSAACPLPAGPGCWLSSAPLSSVWPRPEAHALHAAICLLHAPAPGTAAHCTARTALCTAHTAHRTLHSACCTLHTVRYTLHITPCSLRTACCAIAPCPLPSVHCPPQPLPTISHPDEPHEPTSPQQRLHDARAGRALSSACPHAPAPDPVPTATTAPPCRRGGHAGSLLRACVRLDSGCRGAAGSRRPRGTICAASAAPALPAAAQTRCTPPCSTRSARRAHPPSPPPPPGARSPHSCLLSPPSRGVFQLLATVLSQKASAQDAAVGDGPAKAQDIPAGACRQPPGCWEQEEPWPRRGLAVD
ncbi:Caskin-1-like protein [Aix galericulata]|nr:Caskin-1-like protein [Aix galericulata]